MADPIRLYSPMQVFASIFIGGPVAAIWTLYKNFEALGKKKEAEKVTFWGGAGVVAIIGGILVQPGLFTQVVLPVVLMFVATLVAERYQASKQQILESEQLDFQPLSNVVVVSLVSALVMMLMLVVTITVLDSLGVIALDNMVQQAQQQQSMGAPGEAVKSP